MESVANYSFVVNILSRHNVFVLSHLYRGGGTLGMPYDTANEER